MTRVEALKDLLAKVEHGEDVPRYGRADPCGLGQARMRLEDACAGSLDAAKALHEAVLPGWHWTVASDGSVVLRECDGEGVHVPLKHRDVMVIDVEDPARAWLCAILKALIALEDRHG